MSGKLAKRRDAGDDDLMDAYEEFVGWVATTLIESLDAKAKRALGQALSELRRATDEKGPK